MTMNKRYVELDAALDIMCKECEEVKCGTLCKGWKKINLLPAVEITTGRWEKAGGIIPRCSVCHAKAGLHPQVFSFCPYCGALME